MAETEFEFVTTIIDDKPYKFKVNHTKVAENSLDLSVGVAIRYYFKQIRPSDSKERIVFQVEVSGMVYSAMSGENAENLHNAVIKFGLRQIRNAPSRNNFSLTTNELNQQKEYVYASGAQLRIDILKFFVTLNGHWPNEAISELDLCDNMVGLGEEVREWLKALEREGLLESAGSKEHARLSVGLERTGYRIMPSRKKEAESEISALVIPDYGVSNRFYRLVDLEAEQKGEFVFVIMPFRDDEFRQEVYKEIIRPTVVDALECDCIRNDNDLLPGQLDDKFFSHIYKCAFLIAELTSENPNVVYELGMAHTLNKEVIMLVDKNRNQQKQLSFDYIKFNTLFYESDTHLRLELAKRVRTLGPRLGLKTRVS